MAPVVVGPEGPNENRRARADWPELLGQIQADGNWWEITEVDFASVNQLKNAYQYLKRYYGSVFEFQTKSRGGHLRLFAKRKVNA